MTQDEREELIFDLAHHHLSKTSDAGIHAMAVDYLCQTFSKQTDEQLYEMAPSKLLKKNKLQKPKGF